MIVAYLEKGKKEERSAWYFQSPKTPTSNRTIVVSNDLIKVLKAWRILLIEAGVSPKTVQERLGHSSIQITFDRYVHNTEDMKQEAADTFDEILKKSAK